MHRRLRIASAALSVASMSWLLLPSVSASAATVWSATATQAFQLVNATDLGALPSSTPLRITLALGLRNQSALNDYIKNINTQGNAQYGQHLTPSEFTATYGPTADEIQAVSQYLTDNGFTNLNVAPNRLFVTATGTAAQIEAAFNTHLEQYLQNGANVFANTTAVQVPASLNGIVVSVLGLNNANVAHTPLHPYAGTLPLPNYLTSYTPQGFQKAYDVGNTPDASDTAIAIFAEGDLTQVIKDLRTEETTNGLPQVPVTVVPTGPASTDTSGADEWDMDTQYASGMAGNVSQMYVYDATSLTDSDLSLAFNKFVTDDLAKAGSASFGGGEYAFYLDGSMLADDQVFAEAAAQGQTVFASAGDTGGFSPVGLPTNGVPAGVPDVNYPAASPYVVAVGGTTLLTNSDGSYNSETAWLAGGGGTSLFEPQPAWQANISLPTTFKSLPDFSLNADPNSGAEVYVNGAMTIVGGTSLSSPLALGAYARMETSHNNALGFAAPLLYSMYQTSGFHDIILGDNGPYPATPGYDLATGLGSLDIAQMNDMIGQ